MSIRALLFVDPSRGEASPPDPWTQALFVPLGFEPALARYCRFFARHCQPVSLIIPQSLVRAIPPRSLNRVILHTYKSSFGDGNFARSRADSSTVETLLIDAGRLAAIDIEAALAAHRESGAGMSLFCGPAQREYCCERIASDAAGFVKAAVRRYSDSGPQACQADPIAIVLSRRTFRPDPATPIASFADLARHLEQRVRRAGDRTHCLRHPAVRCHAGPLEAVLGLVEASRVLLPPTPASGGHRTDRVQVRGPLELGRKVRIGPGALIIGPAVIGDGAEIGPGAVVSRSIVLPGAKVPDEGHCHNQVVGGSPDSWGNDEASDVAPDEFDHEPAPVTRPGERFKRQIDLWVSACALVMLAPVFAIVALAVKFSSNGPVLFKHRRQGLGGVEFDCLKFRTMIQNADAMQGQLRKQNRVDGPQFKIPDDPRVTRLGRWLRRTNLDELPQLINVLRGEMSLVGPRPSPDRENQCCPTWRRLRLSVRPGMTGLWQVARSPDRHLTDFQEWIYYDTRYVENRSLRLDLQIIWQTVRVLLRLGPEERWLARWRPQPAKPFPERRFSLPVSQAEARTLSMPRG